MAELPPPVNTPVTVADGILHAVLFGVVLGGVEAEARVLMPWLNLPLISQIFNYVLSKVADLFYKYLARFLTFSIIAQQVDGENNDYKTDLAAYKAALVSGDPNAIAKTLAALKLAAAALLNLNGHK